MTPPLIALGATSIFQTFGTVAGASYVFEFDFGGTENTTQRIIAAVLGANGTTPLFSQVVSDTNLPGPADNSLSHFTFLFIADGRQATVRFTDCAGDSQCSPANPTINVDGVLDNVSVTGPAPAPVTLALLGLGLAGHALGRRRARRRS